MLSKFDTFIFDLGSVLVYLDRKGCIDAFVSLGIKNAESLIGQSGQNGVFGELELGLISESDFYKKVREITGTSIPDEEIAFVWNKMILHTPVRLLRLLLKLRSKGKTVFMLSNVNPIHIRTVIESHFKQIEDKDINSYFDKTFLSHEMHLKKPDLAIFERVKSESGINVQTAIFFDDNADNVAAAQKCGFNAMQVLTPDEMADLLEKELNKI